jgi:hypothetical protein
VEFTEKAEFEVLTKETMKSTVFWNMRPYISVEVYRRFGGTCCLHLQANKYPTNQQETSSSQSFAYQKTVFFAENVRQHFSYFWYAR